MRANHAVPPQPEAPEADAAPRAGRQGSGRIPRPRSRTLAAGGAVLAQVWGLGLGVTSAYAAAGDPATDLVSTADAPALLGQVTGATVPVLERGAAPVGQVLKDRIRAGGLPLPGQATAVPDAFAIAAVLLPSVPPQPRGDDVPRASRSVVVTGEGRPATGQAGSTARVANTSADPAHPVTALVRQRTSGSAGQQPASAVQLTDADRPVPEEAVDLATATPVDTSGDCTTVLVPIAAGMLLTGAAMYKHRGLPGGH